MEVEESRVGSVLFLHSGQSNVIVRVLPLLKMAVSIKGLDRDLTKLLSEEIPNTTKLNKNVSKANPKSLCPFLSKEEIDAGIFTKKEGRTNNNYNNKLSYTNV
mmetsp:Transcript_34882/g.37780  ORF Transcript_34882/g.37780 Transcript_34882/m.37780 type:complete len:103 (+) Transcript_34882:147-455(+)